MTSQPEHDGRESSLPIDDLVEATRLAWRWHGHQTRKGKPTSYMSHLLQVQGLVLDCGGGGDQAVAALLHDALEDAETPDDRAQRERIIDRRFGREVLQIVLDCTDTLPDETGSRKGPWRERKERYLSQLRDARRPSRLVAACDKRHNLGELVWDLRHEGRETFERFNAGPAAQLWYFDSLIEVCRPDLPERLIGELSALLEELREHVPGPGPGPMNDFGGSEHVVLPSDLPFENR